VAVSCSKSGVDLKRGLVGQWKADANAQVVGSQAVLTGGVTTVTVSGGKVYSFDGSRACVMVADSPGLHFGSGQDFSVLAVVEPEQATTAFGVMSIVEKRKVSGITAARGFSLHLEYGYLACQLSPARSWFKMAYLMSPRTLFASWQARKQPGPVSRFISTTPDLRDGKLHHVALTLQRHSKTGGKLYVDGREVLIFDPRSVAGDLSNTEPVLIGNHPDKTLNCAFKGLIGGVQIYRRALSGEEVAAAARQD
jgi:hypothetical protein